MEIGGDHRMVPVFSLELHEVEQVFAFGRIRDDAEQISYLRRLSSRIALKQESAKAPDVKLDHKHKGIVFNGGFLSLIQMEHYVAELKSKRRGK